jgi:hypothetical protein
MQQQQQHPCQALASTTSLARQESELQRTPWHHACQTLRLQLTQLLVQKQPLDRVHMTRLVR